MIMDRVLPFDDPDDCYHIQILKRRKDNPDQDIDVITLDNILIDGIEDFWRKSPRFEKMCNLNNARAYIRPNKRSFRKAGLLANAIMAEYLLNGNYKACKKAYWAAIGDKRSVQTGWKNIWVVDVDDIIEGPKSLKEHIEECFDPTSTNKILREVTTVNGFHILTNGFNSAKFEEKALGIAIHKDSLTLLYAP